MSCTSTVWISHHFLLDCIIYTGRMKLPRPYCIGNKPKCYVMLCHIPLQVGWGASYFDENFFLCWLDLRLWSYSFFYAVVSVIVPISFCFFAYFQIYLTIRQTKQSRNLITQRKKVTEAEQAERSAWMQEIMLVRTLFKIFIIFLISWGPIAVLFCLNKVINPPRYVDLIAIMMAHGNSATNSVVYYWY